MAVTSPWAIAADILFPPNDPYSADPIGWARDVLGVHLWSRQQQIIESVRDHRRTAVRSGHGVGKTATAAVTMLWFLDTRRDSRVISTANDFSQVRTVLWAEVRRLWFQARHRPAAQGRPIFALAHPGSEPLQTEMRLTDGRYAIGISSAPERAEGFQGQHAPHILLIIDEASGVDRRIFEAGSGYMTSAGARMLLLGNPTRPEGEFYAAFHAHADSYSRFVISALDSPVITGEPIPAELHERLPSEESIEDYRRMYGEGSIMWDVRVLGNFPSQTSDTIIALGDVEDAQTRHRLQDETDTQPDPGQVQAVIGCDVARFGDDETIIAERIGDRVSIVEVISGKPTTFVAGRVAEHAKKYAPHVRIVIDDTGVGGGVTDQLRAGGWRTTGFIAGAKAHRPTEYPNRRSELWFTAALSMADLAMDPSDKLAAELTAPRYSYDNSVHNRRVVEPKSETKKRLGRSPDRADAILLTLVAEMSPGAVAAPARTDERRRGPESRRPVDVDVAEQDLRTIQM